MMKSEPEPEIQRNETDFTKKKSSNKIFPEVALDQQQQSQEMVELKLETNENDTKDKAKKREGKYPKIVFLIILNEFCERFSYYGLRTILYIFFTGFIGLEKDTATAIYHAFTTICYFTPVLGAILADGYIGLYKTILFVSIVYFVGEVILTLTSMVPLGAPNLIGPCIGLLIIAIGTGGIKPCVSAFGGNQFFSHQKRYIENFFSMFYLSINIGSTIGTILTPIFRNDVKCFGNDCYPLAFGVPAAFMLLAIIVFAIGTPFYRRDNDKPHGSDNIITKTIGCIASALKNKIKNKSRSEKKHWLEYADAATYNRQIVSDVKALCHVLLVFLPLPVFWALYDQQGSRWTSQAQQLNGRIGSFTIKPDQFQAVNPIFIIILVPLFDALIYPILGKFNILKKHLQRMAVGLIFAIVAFILAALLETQMQSATIKLNPSNRIRVLNLLPCDVSILGVNNHETFNVKAGSYLNNKIENIPDQFVSTLFKSNSTLVSLTTSSCDGQFLSIESGTQFRIFNSQLPKIVIIYNESNKIKVYQYSYDILNPTIGFSQIKFDSFNINNKQQLRPVLENKKIVLNSFTIDDIRQRLIGYKTVDYSDYKVKILDKNGDQILDFDVLLETCARYSVLLFKSPYNESQLDYVFIVDIYPNGIHLAWQLIQIFVMTIGEIMFSVSGISFAYSQAPQSMKSVLQAMWCLTVAIGNLVVVIIAEGKFFSNQAHEYYLFAGLLAIATIVFTILSYFYKYNDETHGSDNDEELWSIQNNGTRLMPIQKDNQDSGNVELIRVEFSNTN